MPRKGYPLAGPRAGGISRLADDAGISRAALSRIMSGQADPSIETLRALGDTLGYTLVQMLEFAGLIEPDEQKAHDSGQQPHPSDGLPHIGADDWWVENPPPDLWLGLVWADLTRAERMIWHLPNTSPATRLRLMRMLQNELEAEVAAEHYGRGLDARPDRQQSRGANGA